MAEGSGELGRIGRQLSYLTEMIESELLSKIVKIQRDIFSDSTEQKLVIALLSAHEPLSLSKIAVECHTTGYAVRRGGILRKILETMEKDSLVRNVGTTDKPRYELNRDDETVRFLVKVFAPLVASRQRT